MLKAIAFGSDETERWLDDVCASMTKPRYDATEPLVAKGFFPRDFAPLEPSEESQSPVAFERSQTLEEIPPFFSKVRWDSLCPHDGEKGMSNHGQGDVTVPPRP